MRFESPYLANQTIIEGCVAVDSNRQEVSHDCKARLRGASIFVSVLLLTAAGLKLSNAAPLRLTFSTVFVVLLAVIEAGLGFWLLSGRYPWASWITSITTFTAFATYNLLAWAVGQPSCGCFGVVTIPPYVGLAIDAVAIAALLRWPPAETRAHLRCVPALALGAVLGPIGIAVVLPQQVLALVLDRRPAGEWIVLDPARMVGQRLPLIDLIDDPATLAGGDSTLLIVHEGCPACSNELARFRSASTCMKAVIVLSDQGEATSAASEANYNVRVIRLRPGSRVMSSTPTYLQLSSGIVVAYGDKLPIAEVGD